jgi:hypothetical protein
MTYLRVQRPLEIQHIGILLWIDVFVGKVNDQAVDSEPEDEILLI